MGSSWVVRAAGCRPQEEQFYQYRYTARSSKSA